MPCISIVTAGEIKSFAIQRKWGAARLHNMERSLKELVVFDVKFDVLINKYAEIDAFSQNLLPDRPLGKTPRNMGKNDIWIAATASVADAVLLTTDHDFDHLDKVFLQLERL
jgi:tRNA(fMet)-specific endonuclease VapC